MPQKINPQKTKIVSIHVPKTAGSSLRRAYEQIFGGDAVRLVYDAPIDPASPWRMDPDGYLEHARAEEWPDSVAVAHGHFPARRFEHLADATWITFLRDPVERAMSHYFYWRASDTEGHPLLDHVRHCEMDFEAFVRLPLIRFLYTDVFFGGFEMSRFSFVGRAEAYEQEVQRLGEVLGIQLPVHHARANPHPRYAEETRVLRQDAALMARVRDTLSADLAFYERYAGV